jgi:membrane associated rhomboid family serine protease
MIPLRDSHPSGTFPFVTIGLILVNSLVWLYEISLGPKLDRFLFEYGLTPLQFIYFYKLPGGFVANDLVPLFTSMFIHAGWLHVIGNMWFLWIFGDNVEDRLGHFRYLLFYLLCGIGASLIHVIFNPNSPIPTVGASGAISGVLGAYLVSYPHARIHTLLIIFIIIRFIELPAFIFLIAWFLFQFLSGASQLGAAPDSGGVAYWAHMGGFVVGIVLLWIMPKNPDRQRPTWIDLRRGR